jgi:hypothetical protein
MEINKMPKKDRDVLQEASDEVRKMKAAAVEAARNSLSESMSKDLKVAIAEDINEELGAGGDPPSDYDEDGEQKRAGDNEPVVGDTGDDLSDEGDGPAVVEAGVDENDDEEDYEDDNSDLSYEDDDELEMGYEDDDIDYEEEDEDDVIEIVEDDDNDEDEDEVEYEIENEEEDEEDAIAEVKKETSIINNLKKANRKLRKENSKIERAIIKLRNEVADVTLFNGRLLAVTKLMSEVKLTKNEKNRIIDRFDDCESVNEIKRTYKALKEAYRASTRVPRKHKIARKNVSSVSSVLNENSSDMSRLQDLAGITD